MFQRIKTFFVFLALVAALVSCNQGRTYFVRQENTHGLETGDPVKYLGKVVGEVKSIDLDKDSIIIKLLVNDDFDIPKESVFQITTRDILGSKQIEIIPAREKGYLLKDGDTISGRFKDDSTINSFIQKVDSIVTEIRDTIIANPAMRSTPLNK